MAARQTDSVAAYRRNSILTASPIELVKMLFDGIRKDLLLAKGALERGQIENAHGKLVNAQEIISELINSLDTNMEITNDILPVYEFILDELGAINITKDIARIDPLMELVQEWRDIWDSVAQSVRKDEY